MISVGLDLSYRRTGTSVIYGFGSKNSINSVTTSSIKTSPGSSIFSRVSFIKENIEKIFTLIYSNWERPNKSLIAVIEGVALTASSGVMMSGLHVAITTMIYENFPEVPILIVPPPTLKMYIGVKARDGKRPIVVRAKNELNKKINNDEADAYFLSKLGYEFLKDCFKIGDVSKEALHVLYQVKRNKRGIFKGLAHRRDEYLILPRYGHELIERIEKTVARRVEERKGLIK